MSNVLDLRTGGPVAPERDWQPDRGECLACFVRRMIERGNCTGTLVWAEHWKRLRSPGASALLGRLEREGGVCDCALVTVLWSPTIARADSVAEVGSDSSPLPTCAGVRARSVRPCGRWVSRAPVTG